MAKKSKKKTVDNVKNEKEVKPVVKKPKTEKKEVFLAPAGITRPFCPETNQFLPMAGQIVPMSPFWEDLIDKKIVKIIDKTGDE